MVNANNPEGYSSDMTNPGLNDGEKNRYTCCTNVQILQLKFCQSKLNTQTLPPNFHCFFTCEGYRVSNSSGLYKSEDKCICSTWKAAHRRSFRNSYMLIVLTTNRLAYLCCQCDASQDVKLARLEVARSER